MKLNPNQLFTWILVSLVISLTVGVVSSVMTHRLLLNQLVLENQLSQTVQNQPVNADSGQTEDQVLAARTTNLPSGTVTLSGSLITQMFGQLETRFKQAMVGIETDETESNGNAGNFDGYLDTLNNR